MLATLSGNSLFLISSMFYHLLLCGRCGCISIFSFTNWSKTYSGVSKMSLEALYHETNRAIDDVHSRLGEISSHIPALTSEVKRETQARIEKILRYLSTMHGSALRGFSHLRRSRSMHNHHHFCLNKLQVWNN